MIGEFRTERQRWSEYSKALARFHRSAQNLPRRALSVEAAAASAPIALAALGWQPYTPGSDPDLDEASQ